MKTNNTTLRSFCSECGIDLFPSFLDDRYELICHECSQYEYDTEQSYFICPECGCLVTKYDIDWEDGRFVCPECNHIDDIDNLISDSDYYHFPGNPQSKHFEYSSVPSTIVKPTALMVYGEVEFISDSSKLNLHSYGTQKIHEKCDVPKSHLTPLLPGGSKFHLSVLFPCNTFKMPGGFKSFSTSSVLMVNPFDQDIAKKAIFNNTRSITESFSYEDINIIESTYYVDRLSDVLIKGERYVFYPRLNYRGDQWKMLGFQQPITFDSTDVLVESKHLTDSLLLHVLEFYKIEVKEVKEIQVVIRRVSYELVSEFKLDESPISYHESNDRKIFTIPVSTKLDDITGALQTRHNSENIITHVLLNRDGVESNFIDTINDVEKRKSKPKFPVFRAGTLFYLLKDKYHFIYVIDRIDSLNVRKLKYALSGNLQTSVIDRIESDSKVVRSFNNRSLIIDDNTPISDSSVVPLTAINHKVKIPSSAIPNPNIGSIDLETYEDSEGLARVYALGFYTNLSPDPVIYYVNRGHGAYASYHVTMELVFALLKAKYHGITFYCHNLARFDIVFLLKAIAEFNSTCFNEDRKFKMDYKMRDSEIIGIDITKLIYNTKRKIIIRDSCVMLDGSLRKLGDLLKVETLKGDFPHRFASEHNLFYKGVKPDLSYYNNTSLDDYNLIPENNWSFVDECKKYLEADLKSLYQIMRKVSVQVFDDYGVNMQDSSTISTLAINIFFKDFYKDNIPSIKDSNMSKDIRQALYGGITEVYRPDGHNLYYYDYNSMYPFSSLNPMPGLHCSHFVYHKGIDFKSLLDKFGFYKCSITTSTGLYLRLLPYRTEEGVSWPLGEFTGWYFSEELKLAYDNGYNIVVHEGYFFNRTYGVFDEYVSKIYDFKTNPKSPSQKLMAKSLLNNLIGRFAINLERTVTELVTQDEFDRYSCMYKIVSYKNITDDLILLTFIPILSHELIKSLQFDFRKISRKRGEGFKFKPITVTSVAMTAAINAYARIHITKAKLEILNKGGRIYYSDTDSIVTDLELPSSMVSPTELGKLKLEHNVTRGIFIAGKTYLLITSDGQTIIKSKGVNSDSLTFNDFTKLLKNINVDTAVKTSNDRKWLQGSVTIFDRFQTINADTYNKRVKIYNNDNQWYNTKPCVVGPEKESKATVLGQVSSYDDNNKKKHKK